MTRWARQRLLGLFSILVLTLPMAYASLGDRHHEHVACVHSCTETCTPNGDHPDPDAVPLGLRLLRWNCVDECRHSCTTDHHTRRLASQLEPVKYHGKWAFVRIFGVTEPLSVIFSVNRVVFYTHPPTHTLPPHDVAP